MKFLSSYYQTMTQAKNAKFCFNGIRFDKKLYKGYWSFYEECTKGGPRIWFSYDEYSSLPKEIREYVEVEINNETDSMTDYFDKDSFNLYPTDKRFIEALCGCIEKEEKYHFRRVKKCGDTYYGIESNLKKINTMKTLRKQLLQSK